MRTICAYLLGACFLGITVQHVQHTFGLFEQVDALSWVLAVALELGIAIAAMYTFDRSLDTWARKVAGVWLGGLLVASYALNVVFYWSKADIGSLLLGLIFPASIAVLGAMEPALRKADKESKLTKEAAKSVNPERKVETLPPAPVAEPVPNAKPPVHVRVSKPEPKQLPDHVSPDAQSVNQEATADTSSASSDWQLTARQLYTAGGISKADIAKAVGKSRQTVSAYLNSLTLDVAPAELDQGAVTS